MTAKEIIDNNDKIKVDYVINGEAAKITITIAKKCVFQKTYICCPRECLRNVEELLYAHALTSLIKSNLITI